MAKFQLGFVRANSLQANRVIPLLLAGTLTFAIGLGGHYLRQPPVAASSANATAPLAQQFAETTNIQSLTKARDTMAAALAPKPEAISREVELGSGETFADLISEAGASDADATAIMNALGKVYDLRSLKAGQDVTLLFSRLGQQSTLMNVSFTPEATKAISIARNTQNIFTASLKSVPIQHGRLAARGEIRSSLYEAGEREGVPYAVMASLIRIYSHDVDFQRDIHPGDRFEILYDQPHTADGTAVGEGSIIYAALIVGNKVKPVYRVTFSDNTVDYFDERGQSTRRALLRTPVDGARVTSGFGMRMHPILGYSKMHQGVDFGASIGTPILAAGNGVIVEEGFKGGYGRYIQIRHNGTLATAYAHMSRFGHGTYVGAHVTQGEVIGYVGESGRATGPHLHFEVHVNNKPVNPLSVNLPTGRILEGKLLAQFKAGQANIKQEFATLINKTPNLTRVSASSSAYGPKTAASCGLRGGC